MKKNKLGSNQFKLKPRYHFYSSVWFIAFLVAVGINFTKDHIVSPCPATGCQVEVVYAKEEASQLQDIINFITKTFEPLGPQAVKTALDVVWCESKFNPNARHVNRNGSVDSGLWQINSINKISYETMYDYKLATLWAFTKVKKDGWRAWYCYR